MRNRHIGTAPVLTTQRITACCSPTHANNHPRRLYSRRAAAAEINSSSDDELTNVSFSLRKTQPERLEQAWVEQTADGSQLADKFFDPYKAPEQQQSKVFVFVRHGHSTWNEQSRIQASAAMTAVQ